MNPSGLTINLLDAQKVVHGQFEVVRVHVLVEGSHDGRGVVGVLQAQRVAELVDRYQEQIVTLRLERQRGGRRRACQKCVCVCVCAAFCSCSQAAPVLVGSARVLPKINKAKFRAGRFRLQRTFFRETFFLGEGLSVSCAFFLATTCIQTYVNLCVRAQIIHHFLI